MNKNIRPFAHVTLGLLRSQLFLHFILLGGSVEDWYWLRGKITEEEAANFRSERETLG